MRRRPGGRVRGVTLVELLVVVSILGVLSALFLARVGSARKEAVDARVVSLADTIRGAVSAYEVRNGSYSGLPRGPSNQSLWDSLRSALSPYVTLPDYATVTELVDWAEADIDYGAMAGRGYVVLLRAVGGTGKYVAAAADGVYLCTGWWSGCTRAN